MMELEKTAGFKLKIPLKAAGAIASLSILCALLLGRQYEEFIPVTFSIFIIINTMLRLSYPSCFVPATQSEPGIIPHPVTARTAALFAGLQTKLS